jgi:hypothetical protein
MPAREAFDFINGCRIQFASMKCGNKLSIATLALPGTSNPSSSARLPLSSLVVISQPARFHCVCPGYGIFGEKVF